MKLNAQTVLFNLAGGGILLTVVGYIAYDAVKAKTEPTCFARFPAALQLGLNNAAGEPLSPESLQARLGAREWGVLANAGIVKLKGGNSPSVLEVKLAKGSGGPHTPKTTRGGVSFVWEPSNLAGAKSACLGYSVYFPADFDWGRGGILPGIFGGEILEPGERAEGKATFAARLAWREGGKVDFVSQITASNDGRGKAIDKGNMSWPRGKWAAIEQEVVLNSPGKQDGIMRVWVDGKLALEHTKLAFTKEDELRINGVVAGIHYGVPDKWATNAGAPADTAVRFSPFELSWQ